VTLRAKLALWVGAIAAVAVALASTAGYLLIASSLERGVDRSLREQLAIAPAAATAIRRGTLPPRVRAVLASRSSGEIVQIVSETGAVTPAGGPPVDETDLGLARAGRRTAVVVRTTHVGTAPVRVATIGLAQGGALRASVDLSGDRAALRELRRRLLGFSLLGALAAAGVGWLAARRLTGPLTRLSAAAEHVAATEDLSTPIADDRPDEVGRLSRSLATMLAALAASRAQQQRLVQDAGHELRTPLTSLRTNLEVLERADGLAPDDRARLLADLRAEVDELTALVGEVVAVAAAAPGERNQTPREEHDLADLVAGVVERHRRRSGRDITLTSEPCAVTVVAADVERAVSNLVDNALKFSPPATPIEVEVRGGQVTVSDHGPGIAPRDAELVFHRFHRADAARSTPGSGLGLAIVAEVAGAHGGRWFAGPRADGRPGATVGFSLPTA
jgi:two-component system sensor histidine kinase MprB